MSAAVTASAAAQMTSVGPKAAGAPREPAEATAQRTIVLCYARHRTVTATARTLITAIRS